MLWWNAGERSRRPNEKQVKFHSFYWTATEMKDQNLLGWTKKALPSVANQQQEPKPARLEVSAL